MSEEQLPASQNQTEYQESPVGVPSALLHDLRTPLNQIIGYVEMLEEQAQDEGRNDFADDLHKVRVAGRELLGLINDNFLPLRSLDAEQLDVAPTALTHANRVPMNLSDDSTTPELLSSGEIQGLLLVVDDNETNREVLSRHLVRQGYVVESAESGQQALQMVRSRVFDLVLLDIMMPGMDGYEVLRQLKDDTELRHLPVIMISALNEIDTVVRCIEMGAEDYLPKPFNPTLLKARVGASLEKKRGHDREMRLFTQLQENYEKLQVLEQMRDDLTHMIVHDLRTPLSSLIVGLQLMGDVAPLADAQKECYDIATRGGRTLLHLVNNLLDISKMESGTFVLELAPLAVPTLVETALEQVASTTQNKQVVLESIIEAGLPLLTADEDTLRRVLVNLLGNALKFTPSNGTISIAACRQMQEGKDSIVFSIADTGQGIPEAAFPRIFEKFGQVEMRRTARQPSTGLGLTFCKMAVEAHGGRIWVESVVGEGSTFLFALPL